MIRLTSVMMLLCVLAGCRKPMVQEESGNGQSLQGAPLHGKPSNGYTKAEKKIFNEEIDAFELDEGVDPFSSFASQDTVSFALVDDVHNEVVPQDLGCKTIYFDYDQYTVRDDQRQALAYTAQKIKQALRDGYEVAILGNSCTIAKSPAHNIHISHKRAEAIVKVLVNEFGIARQKLHPVGRGCEMPLVEGNKAQQAPNRRVEFSLVKPTA